MSEGDSHVVVSDSVEHSQISAHADKLIWGEVTEEALPKGRRLEEGGGHDTFYTDSVIQALEKRGRETKREILRDGERVSYE